MERRIVQCIAGAFLIALIPAGYRLYIVSGKPPSGESLTRLESMPNYHDGRFHNNGSVDISFGPLDLLRVIIQNVQKPPPYPPGE